MLASSSLDWAEDSNSSLNICEQQMCGERIWIEAKGKLEEGGPSDSARIALAKAELEAFFVSFFWIVLYY